MRVYEDNNRRGLKNVTAYLSVEEGAALLEALRSWEKDHAAGLTYPDGWETELVDGEWLLRVNVDSDFPAKFAKPS